MHYFKKAIYLIVFYGFSFAHAGSYEDFFLALESNNASAVRSLLERGFDPNTVNPSGTRALPLAIAKQSWEVAHTLVAHPLTEVDARNAKDETPLMLSALKGNAELSQALIARGADLNKTGWAPLHYAATGGRPELVRLMLEHHAYIDAESPNGSTPLMMAAMYGSIDAVTVLLDAGADATLKNSLGLSAIDFAQRAKKPAVVEKIAAHLRTQKPAGDW